MTRTSFLRLKTGLILYRKKNRLLGFKLIYRFNLIRTTTKIRKKISR
ncbi:MAG: 5.7 kDa unknown protein [Plant associated caulimovirus 1]|nr:MAG: 5.7 kDa unknown protein [Plant associated caulimovirus 1]